MANKGMTFFGAARLPIKPATKRKLSFTERVREIVAEIMLVDTADITDSYQIKSESELMPNGLTELIEISVALEREYELGEVFTPENECVFENFGTLLEFVKSQAS